MLVCLLFYTFLIVLDKKLERYSQVYIDMYHKPWYRFLLTYYDPHGAIAQLGERLTGSQEVVGSIPSSSTNDIKHLTYTKLSAFFVYILFFTCTSHHIV